MKVGEIDEMVDISIAYKKSMFQIRAAFVHCENSNNESTIQGSVIKLNKNGFCETNATCLDSRVTY